MSKAEVTLTRDLKQKAQVCVDVPYDKPLQDILLQLTRHEGRIAEFVAQGPGGGNPMLVLHFPSPAQALDFLEEHMRDETAEFRRDQVTMVRDEESLFTQARSALIECASRHVMTLEASSNAHRVANEITRLLEAKRVKRDDDRLFESDVPGDGHGT